MKRALRVLLPLIMVIVILASLVWYLMVYDPGFTRDTIMATARSFDNMGHHKFAAWLYSQAYHQSQGDDDVAIELADHYKSHGNYTKAERTLSDAIGDGGSLELYVALCQTYVEQDKILDAINMLDQIGNDEIKAQIDAMRPAKPEVKPDAGPYTQYISVSATGDGSKIYLNFDGKYPSIQKDLYTEPVSIPTGETAVFAVAVNENNLVSKLVIQGYTIGGVIEKVTFTDKALEEHVRGLLNFSSTRPFNTDDLWEITTLTMPEGVTTYVDLPNFPYLEELTIEDAGSLDLTPLAELNKLKKLTINKGELSLDSLKAIGALTSLEELTLTHCGLSTVSPFENLTKLTYLNLTQNTLRNIEVFGGFTQLKELHMATNALTDLDALSKLTTLEVLDVSQNSLTTISPVLSLTNLKTLKAANNAVTSIDGISVLTKLQILDLSQNGLKDLTPLAGCTNLTELTLSSNIISDLSVLTGLPSIIRLDVSHNEITELPEFTPSHQLGAIIISYNQLEDIKPLGVLTELYTVDIDYNEKVDSLDPLLDSHHLTLVNCYGTKIVRSPFAWNSGVVVNLDPSLYYNE